jgi:hypothetical protein
MKRYRGYHQLHPEYNLDDQVGGISPRDDQEDAGFVKVRGQLIHGALDLAIQGQDWEAWLLTQQPFMPEPLGLDEARQTVWKTVIRRAVKGWMQHRWTQLSQDFERVSSEQEWQWSMHPMVAQSLRMDQIWRRKSDGHLLIVDFKTIGSLDANWVDRYRNSDQTHLYVQALVERTKEPVLGIQYEGLLIGKNEKDGSGWGSAWTRAWAKGGIVHKKYPGAGSAKYYLYHWNDAEFFDWLGTDIEDQFCTTGPLYPPPNQLLQTKDATVDAEIKWADKLAQLSECAKSYGADSQEYQTLLGRLVERSSDACLKYGWGYACPYMGMCWEGQQPDQDTFQPRIDHHDTE